MPTVGYLAHTKPLFQSLKILDLEQLRTLSLAEYSYRTQIADPNPPIGNHEYQTRYRSLLRPIQHRLTLTHLSFIIQAPLTWNNIELNYPRKIRDATTLKAFKSRLKQHLIVY